MIITENTFEKARKKIRETKETPIIFSTEDDELNRKVLEKEKIEVLLINQKDRKDFQKQRNSGLNQVLAKEAKKKGVKIGINLDEILDSQGKEKSEILARIKQNIKLCNKYKVQMKFVSPSKKPISSYDVKSLGLVLGMPTWMTKQL